MRFRTISLSTLLRGGRLQVHDIVSRRKLNHWWNHDFRPLPSLRNPCGILVVESVTCDGDNFYLNTSTRYRHFTRNGSWSSSTFTYPNRVQLIHQPMVVERCLGFTLLVSWSMRKLFCLFHHFFTVDSELYQFCFDAQPHHWLGSVTVPFVTGFSSNLFKAFTWLGVSVGSCFISMNLWVVIALTSEANVEQILSYPNVCMVPSKLSKYTCVNTFLSIY